MLDCKTGNPRTVVSAVKFKGMSGVKLRCLNILLSVRGALLNPRARLQQEDYLKIEKPQNKKEGKDEGEGEMEGERPFAVPTSSIRTVDSGLEKNNR